MPTPRRIRPSAAVRVASAAALARRLRVRVQRDPLLRALREEARRSATSVWLVGGFVRDAALGGRPRDIDVAVGKGAAALVRRLRTVWGRRAFRFRKRGVTTWRTSVEGREVDLVDAGTRGLLEDLRRRELTVNAIAFELVAGRVEDPLGGLRDLRAARLRVPRRGVVGEDPLRALRLARFLAQFPDFVADRATREEARRAARPLRRVAPERVRDEIDALLAGRDPARGLDAIEELGLLEAVLPEWAPMRSCPAGEGRPDAWRHTVAAVGASARPGRMPGAAATAEREDARVLRWALLLHDVAKPDTLRLEGARPTFHGHESAGSRRAAAILKRLRLPTDVRRRVVRLVLFHLRPHHLAEAGAPDRGMRRLVRECGDDLPILVLHAACDAVASGAPDARRRWRRLRPVLDRLLDRHREARLAPLPRLLSGDDVMAALGLGPGPAIGRILEEIRELQEQGRIVDRAGALAHLRSGSAPPANAPADERSDSDDRT